MTAPEPKMPERVWVRQRFRQMPGSFSYERILVAKDHDPMLTPSGARPQFADEFCPFVAADLHASLTAELEATRKELDEVRAQFANCRSGKRQLKARVGEAFEAGRALSPDPARTEEGKP